METQAGNQACTLWTCAGQVSWKRCMVTVLFMTKYKLSACRSAMLKRCQCQCINPGFLCEMRKCTLTCRQQRLVHASSLPMKSRPCDVFVSNDVCFESRSTPTSRNVFPERCSQIRHVSFLWHSQIHPPVSHWTHSSSYLTGPRRLKNIDYNRLQTCCWDTEENLLCVLCKIRGAALQMVASSVFGMKTGTDFYSRQSNGTRIQCFVLLTSPSMLRLHSAGMWYVNDRCETSTWRHIPRDYNTDADNHLNLQVQDVIF